MGAFLMDCLNLCAHSLAWLGGVPEALAFNDGSLEKPPSLLHFGPSRSIVSLSIAN